MYKWLRFWLRVHGRSIRFLATSLHALGPDTGWRYWKLYQRAVRDPKVTEHWAQRLRDNAAFSQDPKQRQAYLDFADKLDAPATKALSNP